MKKVELKYSKSQIDKAGEALKIKSVSKQKLSDSLDALSNWRAFHAQPLDSFAKVLKTRVKKIDNHNSAIVVQRLKRTPSIVLKLKTHKTMRLSTMQDIGGLRAICQTSVEVYELVNLYRISKTRHELFSLDDYIETPKEDGYRGVHLVYKVLKKPTVFVEIQMRSDLQHIWATAVEVFGTLKNSSFKSGYGDREWLELFKLISAVFSLKEKAPVLSILSKTNKKKILDKTKKIVRELNIIEQLNVYSELFKRVPNKKSSGRLGKYALIILNSRENNISINNYKVEEIDKAAGDYIDLEKKYYNDNQVNVVLVNIDNIKKLELSYPNYFMDTKKLVHILSLVLLDKFI